MEHGCRQGLARAGTWKALPEAEVGRAVVGMYRKQGLGSSSRVQALDALQALCTLSEGSVHVLCMVKAFRVKG